MEWIWIKIVRILFALFLVYTVVYLLQVGISLCISLYEMDAARKRKKYIDHIFPHSIASQTPVSVIIPAHNEADCISGTIESLLSEDYPNLEIIVVNDGSNDNTNALLIGQYDLAEMSIPDRQDLPTARIQSCFHRVFQNKHLILVSKENGGKADALNCGLNLCRHPLCVVLDADTKVVPGSIQIMASQFLLDDQTIACAGSVSSVDMKQYPKLNLRRKLLVLFQMLEYFRTFYTQRILFGTLNANIIISGAFAMFDSGLVRQAGGYRVGTIGEDMEITMRLHTFCASQGKAYRIAYAPEAKCTTQLPFTFRDYYQQRRRWHIGMLQSMAEHGYMLADRQYGWAGIIAGSFFVFYELLSPFLEVLGLATLAAANVLGILNVAFTLQAMIAYGIVIILMQIILVSAIGVYEAESLTPGRKLTLVLVSLLEILIFHPLNVIIKLLSTLTSRHNQNTWKHLRRAKVKK